MGLKVNGKAFLGASEVFKRKKIEISAALGVSPSTYSGWLEKGIIYVEMLVRLCNEFRIPLCYFFIDEEKEEFVDMSLRKKRMPVDSFHPITYHKERVHEELKRAKKDRMYTYQVAEDSCMSRTTLYSMMGAAREGKKPRKTHGMTNVRYLTSLCNAVDIPIDRFFSGSFYPEDGVEPEVIQESRLDARTGSQVDMRERIRKLEEESAIQRAMIQSLNENVRQLCRLLEGRNNCLNEPKVDYSAPGIVNREPDRATSASKST